MNELADRIEALKYPCHEIDSAIAGKMGMPFRSRRDSKGRSKGREWLDDSHGGVETWVNHAPRYTSSIDAAMTLATDDNASDVLRYAMDMLAKSYGEGKVKSRFLYCCDLPRYICAAALRARVSIKADAPINERNVI